MHFNNLPKELQFFFEKLSLNSNISPVIAKRFRFYIHSNPIIFVKSLIKLRKYLISFRLPYMYFTLVKSANFDKQIFTNERLNAIQKAIDDCCFLDTDISDSWYHLYHHAISFVVQNYDSDSFELNEFFGLEILWLFHRDLDYLLHKDHYLFYYFKSVCFPKKNYFTLSSLQDAIRIGFDKKSFNSLSISDQEFFNKKFILDLNNYEFYFFKEKSSIFETLVENSLLLFGKSLSIDELNAFIAFVKSHSYFLLKIFQYCFINYKASPTFSFNLNLEVGILNISDDFGSNTALFVSKIPHDIFLLFFYFMCVGRFYFPSEYYGSKLECLAEIFLYFNINMFDIDNLYPSNI